MRPLIVGLCCLAIAVNQARAQTVSQWLTPSPIGIALTVGQWVLKDRKRVYEIDVETRGPSLKAAKDDGFRLAVEHAVGTLVASETEVDRARLARDEIVTYSSGFVERFEILEQTLEQSQYRLRMRVWVAHSAVSQRLLGRSQASGEIDGEQLAETAKSFQQERLSGDQLLGTVLRDYPNRAFSAEVGRVEMYEENRLIKMMVPYSLRLDYNYLFSLAESLEQTAQRKNAQWCTTSVTNDFCGNQIYVKVISGRPPSGSGRIFGWNTTVGFNDNTRSSMIYQTMIASKPAILLNITDRQGNRAFRSCYFRPELDQDLQYVMPERSFLTVGLQGMSINGDVTLKGKLEVNLGSYAEKIRDAYQINISVVNRSEC